jgi:hypothetical protein
MLGVALRIARRMGLHSESICAKFTILEAEMRRRLWWSLILFDTRIGDMADYKSSTLSPTWDCRIPLNVNDSDLQPEMKEPPVVQGSPTDALFAVVRSELGEFVRHSAFHLDFTNPALKVVAKQVQNGVSEGGELIALKKMIEDKYLKFCDPGIPLHFMTIWTARACLAKYCLVEQYPRLSYPNLPQTDAQRDTANSHALDWIECDTKMMASPLTKGYHWFLHSYFPFPAYIQTIQDLKRRPTSEHSERAWRAISDNYATWQIFGDRDDSPFFKIFANMVLQAWNARDAVPRRQEEPAMLPRIVLHIKNKLAHAPQNLDAENPTGTLGMTMDDLSISMPMGFGSPSMINRMVGQDGYAGMASMGYPSIHSQATLDVDMNQFVWAMDWGLVNSSAGDTMLRLSP